jgi:Fe-S-cluster containining protein
MSACDTCTKPGACCHNFVLSDHRGGLRYDANDWKAEATAHMDRLEMPFRPLQIDPEKWDGEADPSTVALRFTCPAVTPEGRCSIYENRPNLCRVYQPLQDKLCVMYVAPVTEDQL